VLDEPTASLHPLASEILKKKIQQEKSEGKLILVTTQLSDMDEMATEVVYLNEVKKLFHLAISELRNITGEYQLSKAIAKVMLSESEAKTSSALHTVQV